MRRYRILAALAAAALLAVLPLGAGAAAASPTDDGFTFGAVGDNGDNGVGNPEDGSARTLNLIGQQAPVFVQSLGDLAYGANADEGVRNGGDWCTWTAAQIADTSAGARIPYVISAGNHEAQSAQPGFAIEDYASSRSCANPFPSSSSFPTDAATDFGKNSFYDYPADHPMLRMINIGPGLVYREGGLRDYSRGGALYAWLERAMDQAKANQEWIVLTYHVPYLNAGTTHGADMSTGGFRSTAAQFGDVFALAARKKVDLILNGHEHNYQRSKQFRLSDACPKITHDVYAHACVTGADGSASAPYVRGEGPVQVIVGTGGREMTGVNDADGDRSYMVVADDGDGNCGYMSFAVTTTSLTGAFENACGGPLADRFTITGSAQSASSVPAPISASSAAHPTAPAAGVALSPLVIGIIVGGIALVLVVAAIVVVVIRRRR